MCKPKEHVFLTGGSRPPAIGAPCVCGLFRWGTDEQIRELDEVSILERWAALPAKESA